ncbi:MAG: sulfite exporter TauE/SafE family protein [Desulfobulbaceae bacterium]|uniref:Sulfite exporter TauE/SafE family protein n=1 Tax=Candidatus Desulfobia pelagia TaxID=2841692 RepID=A0A8J6NDX5_9BACT|nr:sulfite exporter TauE/SafE family protein [Candidatus Desulfobia pelagia]
MVDTLSIFILGVTYGTTICSMTCLPYLGPFILTTGSGFQDGLKGAFSFGTGKIIMYALFGGLAAFVGEVFNPGPEMQKIMGFSLIGVALIMPFINRLSCRETCKGGTKNRLPLLFLGMATSLVPCPPVAAVFLLAAGQDSIVTGMGFGLFFGLGLTLSPLLLTAGGLGLISQNLHRETGKFMPYLRALAMLVLIFLGVKMIFSGGAGHGMA